MLGQSAWERSHHSASAHWQDGAVTYRDPAVAAAALRAAARVDLGRDLLERVSYQRDSRPG